MICRGSTWSLGLPDHSGRVIYICNNINLAVGINYTRGLCFLFFFLLSARIDKLRDVTPRRLYLQFTNPRDLVENNNDKLASSWNSPLWVNWKIPLPISVNDDVERGVIMTIRKWDEHGWRRLIQRWCRHREMHMDKAHIDFPDFSLSRGGGSCDSTTSTFTSHNCWCHYPQYLMYLIVLDRGTVVDPAAVEVLAPPFPLPIPLLQLQNPFISWLLFDERH